jgi:hypothetical protein
MPSDSSTRLGRKILLILTALDGLIFLGASVLNFGAKIPIGFTVLSFSTPVLPAGIGEIVIGATLIVAAALASPRLRLFWLAYVLAFFGIAFGLLSNQVQGYARSLHVVMLPLTLLGFILLVLEARDRKSGFSSSA